MSDWKGFTAESKSWMNYKGQSWRGKLVFWLRFPGAAWRFYRLQAEDKYDLHQRDKEGAEFASWWSWTRR